jgi:hypothetical protein
MLTKAVTVVDVAGTERALTVREMTVGEIRAKKPDLELISGMLPGEQALLDALPSSEFAKLIKAVVDLTWATKADQGN